MKNACAVMVTCVSILCGGQGSAQQVTFSLNEVMEVQETEFAIGMNLIISAASPTRLLIDANLDLRDIQEQVPKLLTGDAVIDGCGNRTTLNNLSISANERVVLVSGDFETEFFECKRTSETGFKRGEKRDELALEFQAEASTKIVENCFVFEPINLLVQPLSLDGAPEPPSERIEAARLLLLEAFGLILLDNPFCAELPPELAALDPIYYLGEPREIGDGGVGIALRGSVDVSAGTILDILRVLQSEGVLPAPP